MTVKKTTAEKKLQAVLISVLPEILRELQKLNRRLSGDDHLTPLERLNRLPQEEKVASLVRAEIIDENSRLTSGYVGAPSLELDDEDCDTGADEGSGDPDPS